jgi:lipoprotein NlpD
MLNQKVWPVLIMWLVVILSGCSQRRTYTYAPVTSNNSEIRYKKIYTVRKDDTLYSVGFRSGYGYQRLAEWNQIPPPYNIEIGQQLKLFKPANTKIIYKQNKQNKQNKQKILIARKKRSGSQKNSIVSSSNKKVLKLLWQWPIRGKVAKTFSQTGKKGINISGKTSQMVKAAAAGKVVYSGNGLIGYGNLLIIKHNYLYLSAYANNRRLLVNEGQVVKKGQAIAEIGRGNGNKPVLHFEIRKNGKPVNPMLYLPQL